MRTHPANSVIPDETILAQSREKIIQLYEDGLNRWHRECYDISILNRRRMISIQDLLQTSDTIISLKELPDISRLSPATIGEFQAFLANRWQRIKSTNINYSDNKYWLTDVCIGIAEYISKITGQDFYKVLMPTLINTKDRIEVYGDLGSLRRTDFVMSDDNAYGLPVAILSHYCNADTEVGLALRNPYEPTIELTKTELARLAKHSEEAAKLMKLHTILRYKKRNDVAPGVKIQKLIDGLIAGSVRHEGTEYDAGNPAMIAIAEFNVYLNSLEDDMKKMLLSLRSDGDSLQEVWNILTGVDKKSLNCVAVNATRLERIMASNKRFLFPDQETLEAEFVEAKAYFEQCVAGKERFTLNAVYENTSTETIDRLCQLVPTCFEETGVLVGAPLKIFGCTTQEDFNLLFEAARRGDENLIWTLQKGAANIHSRDSNGDNLVSIAAQHGHYNLLKSLLARRVHYDIANSSGLTPLHYSVKGNWLDILYSLLQSGVNVNLADLQGVTPLHFAAINGNTEAGRLLLVAHAGVDCADDQENTPLFSAASRGHVAMVELLLQHHAATHRANGDGETPGSILLPRMAILPVLRALLNRNARVDGNLLANKKAPLEICLQNRHYECANVLLENGADIAEA